MVDMRNRCEGAWEEWKFVPTCFKDTMFEHFQERWQWDERDTQLIRRAWNRHFNKCYKDELTKARKRAKVKASINDIADTSGHGPSWIAPEHWDELITKWSQEKWRARSHKASVSRRTEHNGSMVKHTIGFIPISQHKLVLEHELGQMPTQSELFQQTHSYEKGKGDFVDNKSMAVNVISLKYVF
ncbi:hypothetical protein AXF42_Ash011283 [Apostasia shenzhenica]|uniref:Uncharacterized protein n=1 Tax=Apostasia shenzhenica TaxID=1088818 RepID=A0A2I0AE22_9ASPA|nr:hypothetical protein AXF42_Ash011283 [Apostasia shenzhenica]